MVIRCILDEHKKEKFLNAVKNDMIKFKLDENEILNVLRNIVLTKALRKRITRAAHEDIQPSLL